MMKIHLTLYLILIGLSQSIGQTNYSDCSAALKICDKTGLFFPVLLSSGNIQNEIANSDCINKPFPETNSIWLTWTIEKGGDLGFTIIPLKEKDDIDFILYKSVNQCLALDEKRCMISGENLGEDFPFDEHCLGITGLKTEEANTKSGVGCTSDQTNFLASIHAKENEVYYLFINNYLSTEGIAINFFGEANFKKT